MNQSLDTMCQGARLLGMSQRDERNLEAYFRKLSKDNGYEFVISQLKVLKEHSIRQLEDPDAKPEMGNGQPSIRWSKRFNSPKGPFSVVYKTWRKPSSRIRGIGMLINTITEDHVTEKQLNKLLEGVNSHSEDVDGKNIFIDDKTAIRFADGVQHERLRLGIFSGTDLTGTMIPYGDFAESIRNAKENLTSSNADIRHSAVAELTHALDGEWIDSPPFVYDYLKQEIPAYKDVKLKRPKGVLAREYLYDSSLKAWGRNHQEGNYSAGTVSLLQKPGGKLRTVYNTNRVINHACRPYAIGLEHAFYEQFPHEIFVKRQDKGMETVQAMLRRGHELVSADLSSATDYLNPRPLYNGLRLALARQTTYGKTLIIGSSGRPELTRAMENALHCGLISHDEEKFVHAMKSIDFFEKTAEMPFFSEDLDSYIGLRSGQPLGMMGSFQTLTAMNFLAGKIACERSHGSFSPEVPQFVVVGDDFVGDASIMKDYSEVIGSWNGVDNSEKALRSNRYAEFLSHLITRDHIIAMKPKFHLGSNALWLNAQKSTVSRIEHAYRLSQRDKDALETLAAIGDPTLSQMGEPGTSNRLSTDERLILESSLRALSLFGSPESDQVRISPETSTLSREETGIDSRYEGTELDFRVYQVQPDGSHLQQGVQRPLHDHEDDRFSTTVDHYDHKLAIRKAEESLAEANRKVANVAREFDDLRKALHGDKFFEEKAHPLPNHTSSKVTNKELLLMGMDLVEKQHKDMTDSRPSFPSAEISDSIRNPVDRSRHDQEADLDVGLLDHNRQKPDAPALKRPQVDDDMPSDSEFLSGLEDLAKGTRQSQRGI